MQGEDARLLARLPEWRFVSGTIEISPDQQLPITDEPTAMETVLNQLHHLQVASVSDRVTTAKPDRVTSVTTKPDSVTTPTNSVTTPYNSVTTSTSHSSVTTKPDQGVFIEL